MADVAPDPQRMLVVHSGQQRWAIPLNRIVHVGPIERLSRLPNAPATLLGVTAFRGDVVPVHDLAGLLARPEAHGAVAGGMLVLVRRADQLIGLRVVGIEEIRPVTADEAEVLDIDGLPYPALGAQRPAPGIAAEAGNQATVTPIERGLEAVLAGQAVWLPLRVVVDVMDRFDAIAVPWADSRVPEVVVRGGAVLPIVRIDRLMGLDAMPDGPLIVVRRGAALLAFRVEEVVGIVALQAGRQPLDLDALMAALPGGSAVTTTRAVGMEGGAAAGADGMPAHAYLSFVLADQACLLPMQAIRAVADHVRPAGLPTRPGMARPSLASTPLHGREPEVLAGLRAINGQILPVVDPRGVLGLSLEGMPAADIVVAAAGLPSFVLSAQSVDGVVRLTAAAVHETGRQALIGGVVQLGGRLAWLLTPAALVASAKDMHGQDTLGRDGLLEGRP